MHDVCCTSCSQDPSTGIDPDGGKRKYWEGARCPSCVGITNLGRVDRHVPELARMKGGKDRTLGPDTEHDHLGRTGRTASCGRTKERKNRMGPNQRLRQRKKLPGSMNRYGSEGPWFCIDAETGIPVDTSELYPAIADELRQALMNRIWDYHHPAETSFWRHFGRVTVVYIVRSAIESQGSGCGYQVIYTSGGGTRIWIFATFDARHFSVRVRDHFTVFPP